MAARCAEDQDAFWLYHERLMESSKLNEEVYRRIADGLRLDRAAFDDCLAAESFTAAIDRDIADGKSARGSAQPGLLVNGRGGRGGFSSGARGCMGTWARVCMCTWTRVGMCTWPSGRF